MGDGAETLSLMQAAAMQRARLARDVGAEAAVAHANAVIESWSDRAAAMLREYGQTSAEVGATFTAEDVRGFAEDNGLPAAPDARAWGVVIMRARRAGLIKHAGYETSKSPTRHHGITSAWRWVK